MSYFSFRIFSVFKYLWSGSFLPPFSSFHDNRCFHLSQKVYLSVVPLAALVGSFENCLYAPGQPFVPLTLFTSDCTFTSRGSTFHFFATFSSLLTRSLVWLSTSVRCHLVLSLSDRESTQVNVLLPSCELLKVHSDQRTNRRKEMTGLATDHNARPLFTCWFMNQRVSSKVLLYAIAHR